MSGRHQAAPQITASQIDLICAAAVILWSRPLKIQNGGSARDYQEPSASLAA